MGNQTSQWFALFYLDEVDRLIKEKLGIKYYTRYMDDFILLHEDKAYLQHCKQEIERVLHTRLQLSFNAKTQVFPIKNGVEYLGWRFYIDENGHVVRKMKAQSKTRMLRTLHRLENDYSLGLVDLDEVYQSIQSYFNHLSYGDTWKLRERVCAELVFSRGNKV